MIESNKGSVKITELLVEGGRNINGRIPGQRVSKWIKVRKKKLQIIQLTVVPIKLSWT